MSHSYHIDTTCGVPIYQQLVDTISARIKRGELTFGDQLPTVQEMSAQLGIARGTIKRAYDELEQRHLIEKVQGRGSFVCHRAVDKTSRKEQAMEAIDELLDRLSALDFSEAEIRIILNLKLQERSEGAKYLKVAAVECNPESLAQMSAQFRRMDHVDLYSYLLDDILAYPYKLDDDVDLIVTTTEHIALLEERLSMPQKLLRVALRLSPRCVAQLVRLPAETRIGILCESEKFGQLLARACTQYSDGTVPPLVQLFSQEAQLPSFLSSHDVTLVPEDYERFCGGDIAQQLEKKETAGTLIRCGYQMDEGSLIHLEEKISRLKEKRAI